ncbi:MAG: hypothetical protein ACLR78_07385 [Roseburia sp.]
MKKWNDYESTQAYSENEKLPVGGYVLKVQNVRLDEGKNGNSDVLVIAFDIAEESRQAFINVIMTPRRRRTRSGKVFTACTAPRTMVLIRTTGRSAGLRPSWKHSSLPTRNTIGTGMRRP